MSEPNERIHLTRAQTLGTFMLASFATGLFIGLAMLAIAAAATWSKPLVWGGVSFAVVEALAWLALLAKWIGLIAPLEQLTQLDLDQDGEIGKPKTDHIVKIILDSPAPGGGQTIFANVPTSEAKLIAFSRAVLAGDSLAEENWIGSGKLFSKNEYRAVRDELIKRRMLLWKNVEYPAQGLICTVAGLAAFRYLASLDQAALPHGDSMRKP